VMRAFLLDGVREPMGNAWHRSYSLIRMVDIILLPSSSIRAMNKPLTKSVSHTSPLAGIACVSAGIMFLTCSDALAKWIGQYYSPVQILFLRAAIALPA